MSTAFNRPALWKRVGALALAGTIALGTIGSGVGLVSADSGNEPTPTATVPQFEVEAGSVDSLEGITAIIVGGETSLLADPGKNGTVLAKLAEGTVVTLRIDTVDSVLDPDGVTRWWPVTVDGKDGWVSGDHLAHPDSLTPTATMTVAPTITATASSTPFDFTGEAVPGIQVQVAGDGGPVNMRAEGSADSSVVAEVPDGSIVTLRIDTTDTVTDGNGMRWWPVSFDGKDGWISGQYLRATTTTTPTSTATAGETEFVPGAYVRVKTDSGTGATLREQPVPSGAAVTVWADGQVAQIIGGPLSFESSQRGWFKVSNGANTGYIDGDLLMLASPASSTATAGATATATAVPGSVFAPGDTAMVQTERKEGANLRESGDPVAASKGVVTEGATVTIVSGPASFTDSTNGWFEVSWNGQTGFVDGDLLVKVASGAEASTATTVVTATATASTGTAGELGQLRKGDSVSIATGGDGLNVRQSPADGSTIAGFLSDGAAATIIDGPVKDNAGAYWYKVSNGGDVQGWAAGRFLNTGSTPATTATVTSAPGGTVAATTPASTTVATTTVAPSTTVTATAAGSRAVSAQGFIFPLDSYTVTQGFGCSYLGFYAYDATLGCPVHDGLDLAAPAGTPIHAAKAGTVVAAGWCDCGLGYYVEIDHGSGVHTLYGHMQTQPWVTVGQQVAQGDEIGPVGSTGLSTGPHTHFMVTVDGVAQDPTAFLP